MCQTLQNMTCQDQKMTLSETGHLQFFTTPPFSTNFFAFLIVLALIVRQRFHRFLFFNFLKYSQISRYTHAHAHISTEYQMLK